MQLEDVRKCYKTYSDYLVAHYGDKVYKLPINLDVTCPNRDGRISTKGCLFCSELGAGLEADWTHKSVRQQLEMNKDKMMARYGVKHFIAYFQNYTNTYMAIEPFKEVIESAIIEDIVGLSIATRPDAITLEQLDFLQDISNSKGVSIELEIGLQSSNNQTLKRINRGHTVEDFIQCIEMIQPYGFEVCVHLIPNLPWDTMADVLESVTLMNRLAIPQVKLHSLYVAKGTAFEALYNKGQLAICDADTYIERVIQFIEHAHPDMVFQRLFARAPEATSVFCNWGQSWRKLHNTLVKKMIDEGRYQGRLYRGDQ